MSFLSFLLGEKKKTASVAKERLQIILAHERTSLLNALLLKAQGGAIGAIGAKGP
jgi:cell division topological specificity factor MinE